MDKLPNEFNDKTVLSTPNPIYSSSMAFSNDTISFINDLPERLSGIDNSVKSLSIGRTSPVNQEDDLTSILTASSLKRKKELEQAMSSLRNFHLQHAELTSLPSRYLKPSSLTESSYGDRYEQSESTITESDLLPGNTSTPRESLNDQDTRNRSRASLGLSLAQAATTEGNIDQFFAKIRNTLTHDDMSFKSGEAAIAALEKDELSWKEKCDLPAIVQDFSLLPQKDSKMSLGSFFLQRSDNIPQMLAKSPTKKQKPIPLLETSTFLAQSPEKCKKNESSLQISEIRDIIQSEHSITSVLHELMHNKKSNKTKSPIKMSVSPKNFKEEKLSQISKENHSPNSLHGSMESLRSGSSLSSLPNGKLPIATTKTELIWGCIKPGKTSLQRFLIKNRCSTNRVAIICSVSNPAFQIRKEGSDSAATDSIKIVLQPYESRTLIIIFNPTNIGSYVDNIVFSSADVNHKQGVKQFMKLYAYGGYGNVIIHNVIKDTSLRYLLTLGNIDEQQELHKTFTIKNTGNLPAFAFFYFMFHAYYTFSKLNIYPKTVVLLPQEEKEITISLTVQKCDFNYIKNKTNNCVIDIGKLEIIHGTEVDRARFRRVYQKALEKNQEIEVSLEDLIEKFPGEVIPNDIKNFKETISSFEELVKLLRTDEITVTVEQDLDQTISDQFQDETALFHSLCENTAIGVVDSTILKEVCVEPTKIILMPPEKIKDRILLTNSTKKIQYFEITSLPQGLILKPKNGTIKPSETLFIDISYSENCINKTIFTVKILLDNESFDVDVKLVPLRL